MKTSILASVALAFAGIGSAQPSVDGSAPGPTRPGGPVDLPWLDTPSSRVPANVQKKLELLALDRSGAKGSPAVGLAQAANQRAKQRILADDLAGATEAIEAAIPYERDTAAWHLDAARQWSAVADDLSRGALATKNADSIARTLSHLDQAAAQAQQKGDKRTQAAAKAAAAHIHERFRGDPAAALAGYRAALTLQPDDAMSRESLDRLERSLAILQARLPVARR